MVKYQPMANTFHEFVDCRMVHLEIDFFLLSQTQLMEIAIFCADQSNRLLGDDFFCQWEWMGYRARLPSIFKRIHESNRDFDFSCTADVLSTIVYDSNSFRAYDKKLSSLQNGETWFDTAISNDYAGVLQSYIREVKSPEECKEAVLKIFFEQGRKKKALWRDHDASVYFISHQYATKNNLYRGSFSFRIAHLCINNINVFAEKLIDIAMQSSTITPNINARVALSPISSPSPCSPHMMYFGGRISGDGSHTVSGLHSHEWYPYYYCQGAEWFNLLSPLISSRIPALVYEAQKYGQIILAVQSNGIITLRSAKDIGQTDVLDLLDIKTLLYPILYPGHSRISLKNLYNPDAFGYLAKPRQQWENLPLLIDEISVDEHDISFQYGARC